MLKRLFLCSCTISLLMGGCATKPESVNTTFPEKPNIVFILANHLSVKDLGCYGQQTILTPNIDDVAANGIRFNNYHIVTETSRMNREILLFGDLLPHGNKAKPGNNNNILPDTLHSLAKKLKGAGYVSGIYGIWGFGSNQQDFMPKNNGFNDFIGYCTMEQTNNTFPEFLFCDSEKIQLGNILNTADLDKKSGGTYTSSKVDYSNDIFFREAIRFIKENKDTSFFLFLPFAMPQVNPHAPEGQGYEVPDLSPYKNKPWDNEKKALAAMVTRLDVYVGKIVRLLVESGIDKNTLVIFTSNSPISPHLIDNTQYFTARDENKSELNQLKVPLLMLWTNTIESGKVLNYGSTSHDIYPTILDIIGIEAGFDNPGKSLLPKIIGKSDARVLPEQENQ